MRAKGVTNVIWVHDLGNTPAMCDRNTGEMFCSIKHFQRMPLEQRLFVMLHEKAHLEHDTNSEDVADAQAFKEYAALGYSLTASVKALTQVLNDRNPEHLRRMINQLNRAKQYDLIKNGNTKLLQ
jgi:hypothetical protein